jgi:DNA-binding IclR family transcriptional regulator
LARRLNIPLSEIKNCLNILLTFGLVERDPKAQDYFVVKEELRSQLKNLLEKDGV